jgi:hypothetical protein
VFYEGEVDELPGWMLCIHELGKKAVACARVSTGDGSGRTPLLVLNIVVGATALALATHLATLNVSYRVTPYADLPAIVMAYTATALSVAYCTGRLVATKAVCCSRITNYCSAAHAAGLGLVGDVVVGMLVLTASMLAVLYPTLGKDSSGYYDLKISCAQKSSLYTTDDGCNEYHALQALLWVLCISSVLTVWASVNAFREVRRATNFDDTDLSSEQGISTTATTSNSQGTVATTVALLKRMFSPFCASTTLQEFPNRCRLNVSRRHRK